VDDHRPAAEDSVVKVTLMPGMDPDTNCSTPWTDHLRGPGPRPDPQAVATVNDGVYVQSIQRGQEHGSAAGTLAHYQVRHNGSQRLFVYGQVVVEPGQFMRDR
jgi:hypothetical protein